jgi:uncharacterized membrane protein
VRKEFPFISLFVCLFNQRRILYIYMNESLHETGDYEFFYNVVSCCLSFKNLL